MNDSFTTEQLKRNASLSFKNTVELRFGIFNMIYFAENRVQRASDGYYSESREIHVKS